jgi:autotransporter-associated beta strand protein
VTTNGALGTTDGITTIASGATLDLANVTYSTTEAITNNGGSLSTSTGSSSYAGVMTLGANSTIDVDGTQLTISTAIGDGGNGYAITKEGNGTLVLTGASTFSGDLTISAGTVTMEGTLNDSVDVVNSGTYDVDATDTIQSLSGAGDVQIATGVILTFGDASNYTLSGDISGAGSIVKEGNGTQILSGTNTYTGDTTINDGTLNVSSSGTLAATTDVTVAEGAIYDVDSTDTIQSLSGSGNVEIATSQTLTFGDGNDKTISGVISGAGNLTKVGAGTLTLSGDNTFSGDLTISAGTVTMEGTLADTVDVLNSGTYDVDATDTINSLSGSGAVQIDTGVTLTTGDAGSDEISGVISGAGNLTKAGAGTLTLSGDNTFSGDLTISAGTVTMEGTLADTVDVINSGTYDVDASVTPSNHSQVQVP